MNSLTNKTPFLFRNKKPTLKTHNKTHDVSSPVLDGIAIINVEPNNHYKLISANDIFINYINGNDDNSLGANLLDIFWGENIEDNQIYPQIQKAHSHGQARAFIWNLLINGKDHSILCKIIPLQNKLGLVHQITIMTSEFEDNNGLEIELESYNYFDALTGLPNRFKLLDILNEKYSNSSNIEAAVLFINIKKLQRINESYGYDYGDQAIRSVAEQLQSLTDQNALIARFTDDNFVIILTAEATRNVRHDAQNLAKSIHHNIKLSSDSSIRLSFSIGIATGEISAYKIEQIMQNAHLAMKRNNDHNTTQTIVFNPELKTQASSKL
ncbi:MAG: GGDEF domain-containing protein, partial [Kordiimonadaceae bacterium]|nr:GGDEF domain-containing protein [Kordiimonadaceae bacterium]